jgi:hypothetical protein
MEPLQYVHEHIALGLGWTVMHANDQKWWTDPQGRYRGGGTHNPLPNYVGSLDDVQEAVKSLTPKQFRAWKEKLEIFCANRKTDPVIATAHERAFALYQIL